jgi:hypothetical protein
MATLILGSVGRVIGGPIGGLVGTFLGGAIDRSLFGSGAAKDGARLADLSVQSSAYGEPLPRIYGTMRVAGNLVWTTGIAESSQRSGGGKLGGSSTTYSYSASFAVIVAGRPIVGIERIWADGKLLRASDGTLNYPATIRTYLGDEVQGVDPLIAAAEGQDQSPAYRGRAYAVFEDMPLADYGNRIPNLTFEVVADPGPVGVDAIAIDISGGLLGAQGVFPGVVGFAAAQAGTIRQTLTSLADIADLALGDDGAMLRIGVGQMATVLATDDLGATDRTAVVPQRHEARDADTAVPDAIWLSYGDTARDYQTGIQAATRRTPAVRVDQRDLTIAASACDVKVLAEAALRRAIAVRTTAQFSLPWRYATVRPGDVIMTGADPMPWRVTHRTITGAVVDCEVERVAAPAGAVAAVADAGRVYIGPDAPQGPTILQLLDLPALPGVLPTTPQLLIAAGGGDAAWRRADILVSRDGGDSYSVATSIGAPATIGTALDALAPGTTLRWDRQSMVEVELASDAADLQSATEAAVLAGANLAVIGDEIIQFASVTALGARRFRLADLLRGRRGSEDAVAGHVPGERFVVLDERVAAIDVPAEALGSTISVKAVGPGENAAALPAQLVVPRGAALRPLSPATVMIAVTPGGDRTVTWRRRSRAGYAWSDGTDAPLAEESECYHVTVRSSGSVVREVDVTTPAWTYAATDLAADGGVASSLTVDVAQVSAVVGRGLATSVSLG